MMADGSAPQGNELHSQAGRLLTIRFELRRWLARTVSPFKPNIPPIWVAILGVEQRPS